MESRLWLHLGVFFRPQGRVLGNSVLPPSGCNSTNLCPARDIKPSFIFVPHYASRP